MSIFRVKIKIAVEKVKELNIGMRIQLIQKNAFHFKEDFYIFDVSQSPLLAYPFKIGIYGFCLCLKGETRGTIDLAPYEMKAGRLAVNIPGQFLTHTYTSDDFQGICIAMSPRFVDSLGLPYDFGLDKTLRENPISDLSHEQVAALQMYCSMVRRLLEKERLYQAETLKHLTCAYFYGLGSYLYQLSERKVLSGNELLMQMFLNEVRAHYRMERQIPFYAGKLHISAGYLSTVVKRMTGKTASEWIDGFVILEAKALLKSTNRTVQQISDGLNFPSQSFFGKYFKRMVGQSPKEYRKGGSVE